MANFDSLDVPSLKGYMETISLIGGIDPYIRHNSLFETKLEQFPSITVYNIVYYLIYNSSPFPHDQVKAYKSLEAQVTAGWVRDIKVYTAGSWL